MTRLKSSVLAVTTGAGAFEKEDGVDVLGEAERLGRSAAFVVSASEGHGQREEAR